MGGARSSLPHCPSSDTVPPLCFPTSKIRDEGVVRVQGHGHWDVIPYLLKPEKPCGVSDTHLGPAEPGWVTLAKWHHHWLKEQV